MKKIFDNVRKYTGRQIPDDAIKQVLNGFANEDIFFPSDFTISFTKEQLADDKKANDEINDKTMALFSELNHDDWGNSDAVRKNIATIVFGLVLTANDDVLKEEMKVKAKVSDAYKGGKKDVAFVKGIEYPISLKRTIDVKEYLDTKKIHVMPEIMFEDIRHTKKFTDIPWGVLTHLVSYYHAYDGDVTAKDMLGYVKRKMVKEVPLNKRGANISGKNTDVTLKEFNKYFMDNYGYISHSLSDKEVEDFLNQEVIKRVSLSKKADYFQDYILANGLEDDIQAKRGANIEAKKNKGANLPSVQKRVDEVNELINLGNKNEIKVVDDSGTWQAPMKYKPLKYVNGVLYIEYEELDLYKHNKGQGSVWKTVKDKVLKNERGMSLYADAQGSAQKEVISDIARMYRKGINSFNKYGYKDGGNLTKMHKAKRGATIKGDFGNENALMVINNNKQIKHHTEELNSVVNGDTEVPAWVVAKVNRSASDLSDATHYLEGVNSKYANGGGVGNIESKINELYSKFNFINDGFNWKLKLLEMLQDRSIEAYNIYQSLTKEQKEEVLQELFEADNDMGSYGDGEISTSKENLDILLEDAKNGNKLPYSKGGNMQGFTYEIGGL